MTIVHTEKFNWCIGKGLFALAIAAILAAANIAKAGLAVTGNDSYPVREECASATPSLTLSPTGSQSGEPGSNRTYSISITNNDNASCTASSLDLTVTYLPSGWIGDLSPKKLNLRPGATGTATLSVKSANDAKAESFNLQVAVSDAREPIHVKVATATDPADDTVLDISDVAASAEPVEPTDGDSATQITVAGDTGTDVAGGTGNRIWRGEKMVPAAGGIHTGGDEYVDHSERLTQRLTGLLTAYNQASENARTHALNELVAAAEERHTLLTNLMEDDPGAVLHVAMPTRIREDMPEEVRPFIEQQLDLEGDLEVLFEDYPDGSARLRHYLKAGGEHISLHFKAEAPRLFSDTPVSANGVLLDDAMALESGERILTLAARGGNNGGNNGGTPAPVPNTFGDRKTLVLLVNFEDQPTEPYTATYAQSVVFGTVNDFFSENSYGKTWLSGDVHGWFTIALSSTVCDHNTLASQADSAAQSSGVDLSAYNHIVYAFQNACTGDGIGTVGGNPSRAWIIGELDPKIIAHELGHGLGLWHAKSLDCGATTLGENCTIFAYGDPIDAMGNTAGGHFSAFQKERLNWLNYDQLPTITTVTTSGTYTLAPYETNDLHPKALKILKSTDPITGQQTWYYLEFRQAIGFDGFLADNPNVLSGVLVHTGSESSGDSSYLLDMTPASGFLNFQDWLDPALTAGESFADPDAGVTLISEWVSATEAAVTVLFEPGVPDQPVDQPSVTVSTDKPLYALNQWVTLTARVTAGDSPVSNAVVSMTITKPNGDATTDTTTTGTDGKASYRLRLKKNDPAGNYLADTLATVNAASASAATAFDVR